MFFFLPLGESVLSPFFSISPPIVPCGRAPSAAAALVHHRIRALTRHKFTEEGEEREEEEEGRKGGREEGREGAVLEKQSAKFIEILKKRKKAEQFGCHKKRKRKSETFSAKHH